MTCENRTKGPNRGSFNGLSYAEAERLAMLAEECGEVIQAVGKILRHGYESSSPTDLHTPPTTNREHLLKEVTDVLSVIHMMTDERKGPADFSYPLASEVFETADRKLQYTHHQNKD